MDVLVDMDSVLADFGAKVHGEMAAQGWAYDYFERTMFHSAPSFRDRFGVDAGNAARAISTRPGFFAELEPMPGAVDALEAMVAYGWRVWLCSTVLNENPTCASDKLTWVQHHLGTHWMDLVVLTADKTLVAGDLLVDDKPHIEGARTPSWTHVRFTAPYNRDLPGPRLDRWADWPTLAGFAAS